METEKDVIEIDLLALANAVWHRLWIVILAVIVGTAITFSYANYFITPLYKATAVMYVNNKSTSYNDNSISSSELAAAQSLVDTYIIVLKSRSTLQDVISEANLPYTYEQLLPMITASAMGETEVFTISVCHESPVMAERIANGILKVLPGKITAVIDGSSARVVDTAVVSTAPVSPNKKKYAMMGFLMGAALSICLIVLKELLNDSVRSEEYLIQRYNLPILAVIPSMGSQNNPQNGYDVQYASVNAGKEGE